MRYIGIDPGKTGGIAVLDGESTIVDLTKMPENEREILDFLRKQVDGSPASSVRAALEFVRASPQMGTVSAFTFGRGFGRLEMALAAVEIPYYEVVPSRWQKFMDCRSEGDKNVTKRRAIELWPHTAKITHALADALLLAEWCRRKNLGLIVEQSDTSEG